MKFNPFKPGAIVHPGMFSGRINELKSIDSYFYQTKNGNGTSFVIHGERGIGKSSLLYYTESIARGELESLSNNKYNFLVISLALEPSDTYKDVITKFAREFQRELNKNEQVKAGLKHVWDFISNWEILGVKYNKNKNDLEPSVMLEELCDKIISMLQNTKTLLDGLYIFIDEADKPYQNPQLGIFSKFIIERINRRGINNFGIGIIGLTSVIQQLKDSHESSVRLFNYLPLKQLERIESDYVIELGLKAANNKSQEEITIDDFAKNLLVNLSEGYPHFIQQYAYSAFEADTDNCITKEDVHTGLFSEHGALHQLGERYFDKMYFKEIYSEDYRKILKFMASHDDVFVTRQSILEKTALSPYTVQNAVSALVKKGIIIAEKGKKGSYKISSMSFKTWLVALTSNATDF
jgi:hypothetical protein